MSVIAFITEDDVIKKILTHLDRWDPPAMSSAHQTPERRVICDEDIPVYEEIDEPP